jgi:hypothetical protein
MMIQLIKFKIRVLIVLAWKQNLKTTMNELMLLNQVDQKSVAHYN